MDLIKWMDERTNNKITKTIKDAHVGSDLRIPNSPEMSGLRNPNDLNKELQRGIRKERDRRINGPNLLNRKETKNVREFGDMHRNWRADANITSYLSPEGKEFWTEEYKKEAESKSRGEHKMLNITGRDLNPYFAQDWRGQDDIRLEMGRGNEKIRGMVHKHRYSEMRQMPPPQNIFDNIDGEMIKQLFPDGSMEMPNYSNSSKQKLRPEVGVGEPPEIKAYLRQSFADAEKRIWNYQKRATGTRTFSEKFAGGDLDVSSLSWAEQFAGRKHGDVHKERKRQESLMLNSYIGVHKGGWVPASSIAGGLNGRYGKNFTDLIR